MKLENELKNYQIQELTLHMNFVFLSNKKKLVNPMKKIRSNVVIKVVDMLHLDILINLQYYIAWTQYKYIIFSLQKKKKKA